MELIFATNNAHKLEEVRQILGEDFSIYGLAEKGFSDDIPEPYDTFEANALTKAETIFREFSSNAFADDSGLEVDALGKEPGVLSARYAGTHGDAEGNIAKVLRELGDEPVRTARFKSVIALIINGEKTLFEGTIEGEILREPRSSGKGFGYDPIFQPVGYSQSFAEMEESTKNSISHRAIAVQKMCKFIINSSRN